MNDRKKPNLFVVGAFKGGTTTIYHQLRQHPEVFMCSPKEPRYFAYDPTREDHVHASRDSYPIRGEDEYLRLFAGVTDETVIGEASPIYLSSEIAAENIKAFNPDAKIIVSLRDPVSRAISGYQMWVRAGSESRDPWSALQPGERWVEGSRYAEDLARYYDKFDRTQIMVIMLEQFSPQTFRRLFEFVGVSPNVRLGENEKHNVGGMPRNLFVQRLISKAKRLGRKSRVVSALTPEWLRRSLKNVQRSNLEAAQIPPELEATLARYYLDDAHRVMQLTGLDTSVWRLDERARGVVVDESRLESGDMVEH